VTWYFVSLEWSLPFWTTVEAAMNVGKYGHAIEHTAENILVSVTFGCLGGGVLVAGITAVGARVRSSLKARLRGSARS